MRKFNIKIAVIFIITGVMFSCAELDDDINSVTDMEKPTSAIVNEKICTYEVLKTYAGDIILGADASSDDLDGSSTMTTLLKTNFDQVTPTTELYGNVILSNDGEYDFSSINTFVKSANELELSVYGDAIISNVNQNDTFLTTIAAPITYVTTAYPNLIVQDSISDGSFDGWSVKGDISVEDYMEEPSIKMVSTSASELYIQSPEYVVDSGANFLLTIYVLATDNGEGTISCTGLQEGVEDVTFSTDIGWNTVQAKFTSFDDSGLFSFKLSMGADVTYYINIQGLSLVNTNYVANDDNAMWFECEDAQEIGDWMIETEDEDASGGKYLAGIIDGDGEADDTNADNPSNEADEKFQFVYTFNVETAGTYKVWLRQRAKDGNDGDDSFFMSVDGADYYCPGWPGWGDDANTSTWTWLQLYTASEQEFYMSAGEHSIAIRIREGNHFFDRFYLTTTTNEPSDEKSTVIVSNKKNGLESGVEEVTLKVSDDVKKTAVGIVLNDYISTVLTNVSDINAWTVVQNPLANDGSIAVSTGSDVAGEYYWADYIGDDYIEEAFETAKATAGDEPKLFISESDLNTNSSKLSAIVNVASTNSNIDGIAVSLALDLDSDLDAIESMFESLAESGKLVYIIDLSVSVSDATSEQYTLQSDVYQSVIESYLAKVPTSQQYGISLAAPSSDNEGLWDSDYNRIYSYMGFVVGLGAE